MTQELVGEITEQIQDNMYYKIKTQYIACLIISVNNAILTDLIAHICNIT